MLFCITQHCWLLVQRMNHTYTTSEITIHISMPRILHPLQPTFQGSFDSSEAKASWKITLLSQLSRMGRGDWGKPRGHPGVNATPTAMFRKGFPGALALLPTGWAACRQEGRRQGPGPRAQRLEWRCERMLHAPPRQPSSAKHLYSGLRSRG